MAIDVTVETTIARPRAEVSAYASDPANDPVWIRNIREVEWITAPPLAEGTKIARVAHFLGRRLAYTYLVEQHTPGECLAMRAVEGPFPMTTSYHWTDDGQGGTSMAIRVGGGPGGFFGLAAPLLVRQMRRALRQDLALLKAILEGTEGV